MKKIRSSQPAIPVLYWLKHQSFPVSIVNWSDKSGIFILLSFGVILNLLWDYRDYLIYFSVCPLFQEWKVTYANKLARSGSNFQTKTFHWDKYHPNSILKKVHNNVLLINIFWLELLIIMSIVFPAFRNSLMKSKCSWSICLEAFLVTKKHWVLSVIK